MAPGTPRAGAGPPAGHENEALVQPQPPPAQLSTHHSLPAGHQTGPVSQSKLEALPVEIFNQILTYLTHPRAHLPGFTEAQSAHDFPATAKYALKGSEDLTLPQEAPRWAANLFALHLLSHPLNALSLTSRRGHELVESYCSHLVRSCNRTMFNLPFAQFDRYGSQCVYPDLSGIVYRRLWLQHAPRTCVYCYAVLDCYPFTRVKRVMTACQDCFYRMTLVSQFLPPSPTPTHHPLTLFQTVDEVQSQYHISPATITSSPHIRGITGWALRIDVEHLALQLYGTRAFHNAHKEQFDKPCTLCAITRFTPEQPMSRLRSGQKGAVRQIASIRKRSTKRTVRC